MSQKLEGQELVEKASEAGGGKTQKRGHGVSEQEMYRVTFEVTQVVDNYFNSSEEPKGRVLPSALVLSGSHARLSNLSDEGTFVKDEHFTFRGKEVLRRAGSSARGLLKAGAR